MVQIPIPQQFIHIQEMLYFVDMTKVFDIFVPVQMTKWCILHPLQYMKNPIISSSMPNTAAGL